jgi:diguanylate cyclase (GGDEF)-like protein
MNILAYVDRQSQRGLMAFGVALLVLAGLLHYLTAPNLAFLIYYLIPVALVAWSGGRGAGIAAAVAAGALSGGIWLAASLGPGRGAPVDRVPTATVTAQFAFFLVVLAYVVATLKTALERADELARTDYLTGAANFRSFAELVDAELHRARRYGRPFTVCYLDVDYFKIVNDRWGHSTGDALLRLIVDTTRARTRASDVIARLGGDEFAILLPETGFEAAQAVVAKLRESLLEAVRQRGWPVSFSIGVLTCLEPPDSVDALLQAADALMYSVKNTTRDGVNHVVLGKAAAA